MLPFDLEKEELPPLAAGAATIAPAQSAIIARSKLLKYIVVVCMVYTG
jgi:hypothetical protein